MAFYYVDDSGTATGNGGRYASIQTGAFPTGSGAYATVAAAYAATTAPAPGDTIVIGVDHSESGTGLTFDGASGAGLIVVSANKTNCDQFEKATAVQLDDTTLSFPLTTTNDSNIALYGVYLKSVRDHSIHQGSRVVIKSGTLEVVGGTDHCLVATNFSTAVCEGVDFIIGATTDVVFSVSKSHLYVRGGGVTGALGTQLLEVTSNTFYGRITDMDLSALSTSLDIVTNADSSGVYNMRVEFHNNRLPASWVGNYFETQPTDREFILFATGNGNNVAREYQFWYSEGSCIAEDDSSIYRNNSTAWDVNSSVKTSYKITTDSTCTPATPFVIPIQPRYADLTSALEDTVTVELTTDDVLDNSKFWVEARYPDDTNNHERRIVTSASAHIPFATGASTLSTSSEAWTNGKTNKSKVDLTLSNGEKGIPELYLCVGYNTGVNPLYVCTTVDLS